MDALKTLGKLVGLAVFAVAIVLLFAWAAVFIVWMLAAAFGLFCLAWLCGWPIVVKKNGVIIGHYRRGKFYPIDRYKL